MSVVSTTPKVNTHSKSSMAAFCTVYTCDDSHLCRTRNTASSPTTPKPMYGLCMETGDFCVTSSHKLCALDFYSTRFDEMWVIQFICVGDACASAWAETCETASQVARSAKNTNKKLSKPEKIRATYVREFPNLIGHFSSCFVLNHAKDSEREREETIARWNARRQTPSARRYFSRVQQGISSNDSGPKRFYGIVSLFWRRRSIDVV